MVVIIVFICCERNFMLVLVLALVREVGAIFGLGFFFGLTFDNDDNEVHFYQVM